MRKYIVILFAIFMSLLSFGNSYDELEYSLEQLKQFHENQGDDHSTYGYLEHNKITYSKADKLLNDVYKLVMSDLDVNEKKLLKKAQISWIKYRDNEFDFYGERYGNMRGSLWPLYSSNQRIEFVFNRIELLLYSYAEIGG